MPCHFNPLSPHGERRRRSGCCRRCRGISIHSPHTGRDRAPAGYRWPGLIISIHSPHTGRDISGGGIGKILQKFQSTLPTRGETCPRCPGCRSSCHFNPLSPHGERRSGQTGYRRFRPISIHSPHTGRDPISLLLVMEIVSISIHSPHTGRDQLVLRRQPIPADFNPLSPHGERQFQTDSTNGICSISIHSPHTGRDDHFCRMINRAQISIHSPHTGRDNILSGAQLAARYFNPLSPHGERRFHPLRPCENAHFNPLSPHGERPAR